MSKIMPFIVFVLLIFSCSDKNPLNTDIGTGTVLIECQVNNIYTAKIAELKPTIRAEISFYDSRNILLVKKALDVNGNRISGSVTVKTGSGYSAELYCYDSDNRITHSGTASDVSIVAGKETKITILLQPALPETPLLTSLKSSVSTDSTYILTWSEVSRAKSYTIEESPDSIFTDSVSKTIVGISESFTKTTDTVQTYYYRIRANNATGSSGWSNVVSITIETESKTEITMVSIPAGSFQMGSNNGESDEQPVHTVTLDSFKMSGYEITQGQYFSVIGTNPSHFTGDDTLPVENVSWIDAALFCNRLSDKEGFDSCYNETSWECDFSKNGYRLPTEAEWEYVCRAGTTSKYYSGDDEIGLNKASWYGANSDNKTHPVGRKDPNDWGLYDMHGNVWELCNDWYGEKYYSESPEKNPTGPETDTQRVMRGGSWATQLQYNSSSNRHYFPVQQTDRNEYVGFRVVRGSD